MTPSTQGPESDRGQSLIDLLFDRETPARPSAGMRPPLVWASMGAFFAAILALGVSFGSLTSAFAAVAIGVVIIPGWPVLLGLTNRAVSRVIMLITLAAAVPAAYFGTVTTTMGVATGAILLSFVGEMFRRDGRIHLVEHVSASAGGAMMMVSVSFWVHVGGAHVGLEQMRSNPGVVVGLTFAICIAVAALIHGFDSDRANWLGIVNATLVGGVSSYLFGYPLWIGLLFGLCVGMVYAVIWRGLQPFKRPLTWVQGITKSLLPHCSLGVIGYVFTAVLL
ncbi:hypothetical protein J2S70_001176 [Trueperella bonasi]|uniref:Uncharacterized protein n=1 Tax=Trueperella bonasi TaxID=312286 RepID=A0ABT9NGX4_9ACTO|nr:hypothetical protein [Trueperella bonasi]MDP9806594.1 hypothetical protein [Trueperella bonasi]